MANNPALQMLMVATLKGFPYHWQMGEDNILLVSVGTGMTRWKKMPKDIKKSHLLNWAASLPDMFMQDASWQNQQILQWLSHSPTAFQIDSEVGVMKDDLLTDESGRKKGLISYLRYNLFIDTVDLNERFKTAKPYTQADVDNLAAMDNAENCQKLYDLGFKAGEQEINPKHFPAGFTVKD